MLLRAGPRSSRETPKAEQRSAEGRLHLPAPPVPHGLALSHGLLAGEQVRMLSVDDIQIISAAHLHLGRLLLEQDLAAQLVKDDGVHGWAHLVLRLYFSVVQKSQKYTSRARHKVQVFLLWGKRGCF